MHSLEYNDYSHISCIEMCNWLVNKIILKI